MAKAEKSSIQKQVVKINCGSPYLMDEVPPQEVAIFEDGTFVCTSLRRDRIPGSLDFYCGVCPDRVPLREVVVYLKDGTPRAKVVKGSDDYTVGACLVDTQLIKRTK